MAECYGVRGAYQHIDVRIGWFPMRTKRETWITTEPNGGSKVKKVPKHGGVAVQSARNPTGSPRPPKRLPVEGCVWAYSRAGTFTGWISLEDLEIDPDAASKPPLLGPAGRDFEVGRTLPLPKRSVGCGKRSLKQPVRAVEVETAYLRYSPRGTAFHYLHRGDQVRLILTNASHGFCFVEVLTGTRKGSRGWTLHESLEPWV